MKKLLLSSLSLCCFAVFGQWASTPNNTSNNVMSAFGKAFASDVSTSGLNVSVDDGATWAPSNTGVPSQGLILGTVSSNNLYAYKNFSVYSTGTGNNWSLMPTVITSSQTIQSMTPLSPLNVTVLAAVSPSTGIGIKIYQTNGVNWTLKSSPTNSCIPTVLRDLGGTLYAGTTNTGVIKSTDGGMTFTGGLTGMPTQNIHKYIRSLASSGNTLYCGTGGGRIVRSTDNGANWSTVYNIGDDNGFYGIYDMYVHSSTAVFCATDSGFVYTTNGGNSWQRYNTGLNFGNFENLMRTVTVSGSYIICGINTTAGAGQRVVRLALNTIGLSPATGVNEMAITKFESTVYPNPTSGNVSIEVDELMFDKDCSVNIYDAMGREVLTSELLNGKAELNLENYSKGLYTFTISNKNGIVSRGKLLVN
jgi:hypothetical protein